MKNSSPGPGAYKPNTRPTKKQGSSWGFGTAAWSPKTRKDGPPGPGQYASWDHLTTKAAPRGLILSRKADLSAKKGRNTPGPGTYKSSTVDKPSAPKYGFGSSARSAKMNKDVMNSPGAGAYDPSYKPA